MLLAVDIGNTNTVFAMIEGTTTVGRWRASASVGWTADEYAVWLSQIFRIEGAFSLDDVTDCIVCCVVPHALHNVQTFSRRYVGKEALVVMETTVPGIEVLIDRPAEVGADRLANAVGAFVTYGGPTVVVDSGTATNFDLISEKGDFLGGIIAPGIHLSMQALYNAAARLPRVGIERPAKVIGTNTVGAMQSGVFWGYVDLIDGMVRRIEKEYGQELTVVATGGVSSLFSSAAETIDHYDADLTISGLKEIARRMMEGEPLGNAPSQKTGVKG
ncbi:transcriptional activator, putative, Baf family protein [Parvularcula bermudensis HTCC2503]|uniref:Type III pantothenate kinase n=1 Tax=Parvularcula bermudensis (strain ATCC BAA-594 / HTCC2503 / KCTC 12087) TaxID=314260 RepID=E0TDV3_PARBH|nr:type III pantothenate kinase [Parvularcula bermudensis]ADM10402.1 transcriptional activator, putative, Baf family protein [Parvularcula bermudensis HTCC2503]